MWKSSRDILSEIHGAHGRLKNAEITPEHAAAEARILDLGVKVIDFELKHAKLTKRLGRGSDGLSGVVLGN